MIPFINDKWSHNIPVKRYHFATSYQQVILLSLWEWRYQFWRMVHSQV